jgi:hypothetical protein
MIINTLDLFCDALAVDSAAGTTLEGDVKNLVTPRDIGAGHPIYLIVLVSAAFTSGGAATVNIKLASDDAAAISTTTSTIHWQTGALAYTVLTAGKTFVVALPQGLDYEQYLGILVTTAAATTTAGSITAFLSPDPVGWKAFTESVS